MPGTASLHLVNTPGAHTMLQALVRVQRTQGQGMALRFYGKGSSPKQVKKVIAETDKYYLENKSGRGAQ